MTEPVEVGTGPGFSIQVRPLVRKDRTGGERRAGYEVSVETTGQHRRLLYRATRPTEHQAKRAARLWIRRQYLAARGRGPKDR